MNRTHLRFAVVAAALAFAGCAEAYNEPAPLPVDEASVAQPSALVDDAEPVLLTEVVRGARTVEFGGVGIDVEVGVSDGGFQVTGVADGMPAALAGLRAGMQVVAVDGMETVDMDAATFERLVRGAPGASVTLTVLDGGSETDVVLDRAPVVETVGYCERLQEIRHQTEFGGVGLQLRTDEAGTVNVVSVFDDMPAAAAGVVAGDVIVGIDGMSVEGANQWDVVGAIRGDEGAPVALDLRSVDGSVRTVEIERVSMVVPERVCP